MSFVDTPSDEPEYELVLAFVDESEAFANGFEAGGIWERLKGPELEHEITAHSANRELYERMAASLGWSVETAPTDVDGWDEVKFTKDRKALDRRNPHGLRLV